VEGNDCLFWEGHDLEEIDPAATFECLWEFIEMADASPEEGLAFIEKWGLIDPSSPDGGWSGSAPWDEAYMARQFLICLAITEAEELVPEELLWWLGNGEGRAEWAADSDEVRRRLTVGGIPPDEVRVIRDLDIRDEVRLARWRKIRRSGEGLPLQRRLLANILDSQIEFRPTVSVWDERGRRVERVATGVKEIAWSHLYSLFTSARLDIYVCSLCGRPYEFDEAAAQRRPRRGAASYCGDKCRQEARRRSNRDSWKRNSQRWRPPGSRRKNDDSQS
jgi:hypothetical protein